MNFRNTAARTRPWQLVLLVILFYNGFILVQNGYDPLAFATIGTRFAEGDPSGSEGYDGQFTFYIARDLTAAEPYLDVPAYRFQRILLPILARMISFGNIALIPWTLIVINIGAQTLGTVIIEGILLRLGVNRWYAITYGLWAGLIHAVRLDLHEPLSYALILGALAAQLRERHVLVALLFFLAVFAKETALVFVSAFLVWAGINRYWRTLLTISGIVILPHLIWQGWLALTFGEIGLGSGGALATPFEIIPFMGLFRIGNTNLLVFLLFMMFLGPFYILPAIVGIVAALRRLFRSDLSLWVWILGANAAVIPFTPFSTFREPWAMLRFGTGLVLAWLLFAAYIQSHKALLRTTYWVFALVFLLSG